jgi:F0F1-type ATP synthase delta subunit
MKIKPRIYAKTLIELSTQADKKKTAKYFWEKLQKNHQHKDLKLILDMLDEEAAIKNNKILAKLYSQNELNAQDEVTLINKLKLLTKKEIILKKYISKNTTGIIVKIGDKIYDYSLEGKINRLKSKLGR